MKIVRKDYDKPNRCPGWSGSGIREYPWERGKPFCDGGFSGYYTDDCNNWRVHRCYVCGLRTLPFATTYIDPDWYLRVKLPKLWWRFRSWLTISKYIDTDTPFMMVVNFLRRKMTSETESQLKNTDPQSNTKKTSKRTGLLTGACYSNMHNYCPANHTPQVCQCKCHDK